MVTDIIELYRQPETGEDEMSERYDHVFTVRFVVSSNHVGARDVTMNMMRAALLNRIVEMDNGGKSEWQTEWDTFDTHEDNLEEEKNEHP